MKSLAELILTLLGTDGLANVGSPPTLYLCQAWVKPGIWNRKLEYS